MTAKAKALKTLYIAGKVTKEGLEKAVSDGVISIEEFEAIISHTSR